MDEPFLTVDLPDEAATISFAEDVAACLGVGDTIALSGDLGAGKTTFARALIRAFAADLALEVPSPTFTLVQSYATERATVAHVDLYRITDPAEIAEAGLFDAGDIVVVEWPGRAGATLPDDRLEIALEIVGDGRRARARGPQDWQARLVRSRTARAFLKARGFGDAHRLWMRRDLMPSRGEHMAAPNRAAALIDWRLDEGEQSAVADFAAATPALGAIGLSAPEILAVDRSRGFALTEDFGSETLLGPDGRPVPERYFTAIEALAEIHVEPRPEVIDMPSGRHRIRPLDGRQLAAKAKLFSTVYVIHHAGKRLSAAEEAEFDRLWWALFERLVEVERGWVVEPVGSKTVFWSLTRSGLKRVGILPLRGLYFGPTAYDVASLCQDEGATIDAGFEAELRQHYVALRRAAHARFDSDAFEAAYAITAAVRASAWLGLTAPLTVFDPVQTAARFPRYLDYLRRALAHPVLSDLAVWYEGRLARVA